MTIFGVCDMLRLTTRIRGWSPSSFELFSTAEKKEEIMQTKKVEGHFQKYGLSSY
jgi:hypothetical protein